MDIKSRLDMILGKGKKIFIIATVVIILVVIVLLIVQTLIASNNDTLAKFAKNKMINNVNADIRSYNSFALEMFNQSYKEDGNVFLSPASIYLALGVTYNGAAGNTATQMAKVLKAQDMTLDQFNSNCLKLQNIIKGYGKDEIILANSIWIRDTFKGKVIHQYIDNCVLNFGSEAQYFSSKSTINPTEKINEWVSQNTKGNIKKVVEDIKSEDVMVLVNSIYFNEDWAQAFDLKNTKDELFNTHNSKKTVKMMSSIFSKASYIDNNSLQGIRLKYEDTKTSMIILLPKKDLLDLKSEMSDHMATWIDELVNISNAENNSVNLMLPKFKIEYMSSMNDYLKKMGMIDAFSSVADFSNMAKDNSILISEVSHASFLEMNESGTKAAAAISVRMAYGGSEPEQIKTMKVDKPFIVAIVDDKSEAILFLGVINNPV